MTSLMDLDMCLMVLLAICAGYMMRLFQDWIKEAEDED